MITKEAIEAASATYWQNHWKIFSENAKRPIRETMEKALEAALPFLPIAGEGKVKALEWREWTGSQRGWQAESALGQYQVCWLGDYECWQCSRPHKSGNLRVDDFSRHEKRAEAQSAAQSDYETRILSALISSPSKDGGQEVEEHAKWLEACATNEPSESDAARLWAIAQLLRSSRSQPASTALVDRLTSALTKLEREASEVSKIGAKPGSQWTRLAGALINARSALSASTSREEER